MPPTQTRRSHAKSRRGCYACKKAHVKCDEGGPPCDRCKFRGTSCGYSDTSSSHTQTESTRASAGANVDAQALPSALAETQIAFEDLSATTSEPASLPPRSTITHDSDDNPTRSVAGDLQALKFPPDRRLLELQLMHRWASTTWKSCRTPGSGDDEVWQFLVPALALEYDYLLNGLLALAAFDIASEKAKVNGVEPCGGRESESEYKRYVNAAFGFHGHALGRFRDQLPLVVDCDNSYEAALCMSLMLMILAFASAQFTSEYTSNDGVVNSDGYSSMVQSAITHFELVRGCVPVVTIRPDFMANNSYLQRMPRFENIPRAPIDGRIDAALAKLRDLNDERISLLGIASPSDEQGRLQAIAQWEACKKALNSLRECFEKCSIGNNEDDNEVEPQVKKVYQGYALGWLNMAGEDYIAALKEDDIVALLLLMHWGVLLDSLGKQVWWAKRVGLLLVEEILRKILKEDDNDTVSGEARGMALRARELLVSVPMDLRTD